MTLKGSFCPPSSFIGLDPWTLYYETSGKMSLRDEIVATPALLNPPLAQTAELLTNETMFDDGMVSPSGAIILQMPGADMGLSWKQAPPSPSIFSGRLSRDEPQLNAEAVKFEPLVFQETRTLDGSNNNETNSDWGSSGSTFIRLTSAAYHYENNEAYTVEPRTNYRELSNDIVQQDAPITNTYGVSDLFTFFGQFIDHDIDIAAESDDEGPHVGPASNEGNPAFLGKSLGIERSEAIAGTGTGPDNPLQHANGITSYVDASNVYGSDDATLASLRDAEKPWLLSMSADGNLLPIGDGPRDQFEAGDVRAGENSALTAMHTIWAKEHNRIADDLKSQHPDWSIEEVFETAKIKVEALMQHIVFDEWLPLLVGNENIPSYGGYDATVDPSISHEFATAAFRLGHSLLSSRIERSNEDGSSAGDLQLAQMFFNASVLKDEGSVDTLVRGIASQTAQEIDQHLVEDVRSLLFPGADGVQVRDLSVLNHLRGLDHGLGTLNEVRNELGLGKHESFLKLTGGDGALADALAQHYSHVDQVDLWIGGLIEDKVDGSQLGETFQTIVLDQFVRLRDGDRFYYEERLADAPHLLDEIKDTSFSDIITRNTDIAYMQDDAFVAHNRVGGDDGNNKLIGTKSHDLLIGFDGKDRLFGRKGDDDLYGGAGRDALYGGRGNDILNGESGNDRLHGGFGHDNLYGGAGRDTLHGGRGNDILNGGTGNDHLHGGLGIDIFVFDGTAGHDRVYDFETGVDKLDISELRRAGSDGDKNDFTISAKPMGVTIDFESGDQINLVGVSCVSEDDFVF
jgi:peroxidase